MKVLNRKNKKRRNRQGVLYHEKSEAKFEYRSEAYDSTLNEERNI